jgi:glycine betaine/proline transport system substrate-binding protein
MKTLKTLLISGTILASTPAIAADIAIGVPNWPSVTVTAKILETAIEQNLGYDVELQNGTNSIVFEAMDSGSMQIHPEIWMPNQQNLVDKFVNERSTVVMSENSAGAFQGMCVDKATSEQYGITSIDDLTLPEVAELIDRDGDGKGDLWIGVTGWQSTNVEKIRAKSYGYDQTMELKESDDTIAYAEMDNLVKQGKPWIGFCYGPHYAFALQDLVRLEEPEHDPEKWNVAQPDQDPNWLENSEAGVAWPSLSIHVAWAKALEEEYPGIANMLSNVQLTTDQLSGMTYALVIEKQDADEYARQWIADNEDEVLNWFTQ